MSVLTQRLLEARLRHALAWAMMTSVRARAYVGDSAELVFAGDSLCREAPQFLRVRFFRGQLQIFWIDQDGHGGPFLVRLSPDYHPLLKLQPPVFVKPKPPRPARVFVHRGPAPRPAPEVLPEPVARAIPPRALRPDVAALLAHPSWSAHDDLFILRQRALGGAIADIARMLGRSSTQIIARWHRLRVMPGLHAALTGHIAALDLRGAA